MFRMKAPQIQAPQNYQMGQIDPLGSVAKGMQMGRAMQQQPQILPRRPQRTAPEVGIAMQKFMASGGADQDAAQVLAMNSPEMFQKAQLQLKNQQAAQEQRGMNRASKKQEFARQLVEDAARAGDLATAKQYFAEQMTSSPFAQQLFTDEERAKAIELFGEDDYAIGQKMVGGKGAAGTTQKFVKYDENGKIIEEADFNVRNGRLYNAITDQLVTDPSWKSAGVGSVYRTDAKLRETQGTEDIKARQKALDETASLISPMESKIALYDEALLKVGEGAGTGYWEGFLPSVKASTKSFEAVRNKLALNELSLVSMGALSEKEMEVLQETAIPDIGDPDELTEWLTTRKRAEQKALMGLYKAYQLIADGKKTAAEINAEAIEAKKAALENSIKYPTEDSVVDAVISGDISKEEGDRILEERF